MTDLYWTADELFQSALKTICFSEILDQVRLHASLCQNGPDLPWSSPIQSENLGRMNVWLRLMLSAYAYEVTAGTTIPTEHKCDNSKLPNQQQSVTQIAKRGVPQIDKHDVLGWPSPRHQGRSWRVDFQSGPKSCSCQGALPQPWRCSLAKSRTLSTWLKGHRSMEMVSLDCYQGSPAKGALWGRTLQPPAWPTFRTPPRASEGLAPGWTVESRTRLRTVVQAKGISTCTPSGCRVRTAGESRSWQTPPVCLRGPRVRSLTMRPSLPRRHPLSGWPTPASPTPPALSRISAHQTRPCLTDPAPSTPSALPRISAHQTRPCLGDGGILARWHWPRLPSRRWLLYLWDRALPDTWPWTSLPTGPWRGCGAGWDWSNSVLFAKTSNEPETFVSSRSRVSNSVSFPISGCSEPPRSRRPGNSIHATKQLYLRFAGTDLGEFDDFSFSAALPRDHVINLTTFRNIFSSQKNNFS